MENPEVGTAGIKPEVDLIDVHKLVYGPSQTVSGAGVAHIQFSPCDVQVIHYPEGTKIPLHHHTGETLKVLVIGRIKFSNGVLLKAREAYRCNGRYSGIAEEESYLLLFQKAGTKVELHDEDEKS